MVLFVLQYRQDSPRQWVGLVAVQAQFVDCVHTAWVDNDIVILQEFDAFLY